MIRKAGKYVFLLAMVNSIAANLVTVAEKRAFDSLQEKNRKRVEEYVKRMEEMENSR